MVKGCRRSYTMQEIEFRIQKHSHGTLSASCEHPSLTIEAASLEELQHEAREALIACFGPSHVAYRVRIRRSANPIQARHRRLMARNSGQT